MKERGEMEGRETVHSHDYGNSRFLGHAPGGELHECQECGETFVRVSARQLSRALAAKGWASEVTDDTLTVDVTVGGEEAVVTVYRDGASWAIATPQGMGQARDGDLADVVEAVDEALRAVRS